MTTLVSVASNAADISFVVSDNEFLKKGYASIELSGRVFHDPAATVRLSVVKVENRSQAILPGFEHKRTGLSWNRPVVGSLEEIGVTEVRPDLTGKWFALLYDVMGEREITLAVRWTEAGRTMQQNVVFETGGGPLSRFTRPVDEPLTWFELYEKCNGVKYKGNPGQWYLRAPAEGGPRFPGGLDIQSVAGFGKYSKVPAWGAAIAAGWPTVPYRWWLSTVSMGHKVRHMDLIDGNPHGGGTSPDSLGFGVCLKQGETPRSDIPVWSREQADAFIRKMHGRHPLKSP